MFLRLVIVASALGLVAGQEMTSAGGDILIRTTRQVGYRPFSPSPARPTSGFLLGLLVMFAARGKKEVRDFKPGRSLVTHEHCSDRNHPASDGPCRHPYDPQVSINELQSTVAAMSTAMSGMQASMDDGLGAAMVNVQAAATERAIANGK